MLSMLEMTKNALNEENLELALNVFSKDNFLDEINAAAPAVLTKYLETHPDNFLTCLELGTVIRKLERAGDHITNIAEEIVFFIDAKVLKHRGKWTNISWEKKKLIKMLFQIKLLLSLYM